MLRKCGQAGSGIADVKTPSGSNRRFNSRRRMTLLPFARHPYSCAFARAARLPAFDWLRSSVRGKLRRHENPEASIARPRNQCRRLRLDYRVFFLHRGAQPSASSHHPAVATCCSHAASRPV